MYGSEGEKPEGKGGPQRKLRGQGAAIRSTGKGSAVTVLETAGAQNTSPFPLSSREGVLFFAEATTSLRPLGNQ